MRNGRQVGDAHFRAHEDRAEKNRHSALEERSTDLPELLRATIQRLSFVRILTALHQSALSYSSLRALFKLSHGLPATLGSRSY